MGRSSLSLLVTVFVYILIYTVEPKFIMKADRQDGILFYVSSLYKTAKVIRENYLHITRPLIMVMSDIS